jgi:hypothetical protein
MTALSSAARRDPMVAGESVARAAVTFAGCFIAVLTFGFSFGNVWALGIRLGVPAWVAPLVGPSVDLSVVGLLFGLRHLATHGADRRQLRPARLLLLFSCATTLALNAAEPISRRPARAGGLRLGRTAATHRLVRGRTRTAGSDHPGRH